MYNISIITAAHSQKYIEAALDDFSGCSLRYFTYETSEEAVRLYENQKNFVDGMIFSGELTYQIIKNKVEVFDLPVAYLELQLRDFYKELLRLSTEQKLDFKRMSIDFLNAHNDYMGLGEIVSNKEFPHYYADGYYAPETLDNIVEYHERLYKADKIDIAVTRFSNAFPRLEELGLPAVFIFPSEISIKQTVEKFLNELEGKRLLENQIAIGKLSFSMDFPVIDIEIKRLQLHQLILEYAKREGVSFLVQYTNEYFEIVTTYGDLQRITNQLTSAHFYDHLTKHLPISMKLGWGVGGSIQHAKDHAAHASKLQDKSGPYVVSDDEIIGPLRLGIEMDQETYSADTYLRLGHQMNIPPAQLQKVMYVLKKIKTDRLRSDELSFHLGISTRNANRILNNFVAHQLATVKHETSGRGRPQKVFVILTDKIIPSDS